jgi:RimJ/RimL family protein N-acetyltransferase
MTQTIRLGLPQIAVPGQMSAPGRAAGPEPAARAIDSGVDRSALPSIGPATFPSTQPPPQHAHHRRTESEQSRRTLSVRCRRGFVALGIKRPRILRGARLDRPILAPVIFTDRLVLRQHHRADTEAWFELQSDPQTREFLPWPVRDRAASAAHLHDRTHHTVLWQADDFLALAIILDGRLIGDVSVHLRSIDVHTRSVELGWVLNSAYAGHGFATEATSALLDFVFSELDATIATAVIQSQNSASLALAARLGFVKISAAGDEIVLMISRALRQRRQFTEC